MIEHFEVLRRIAERGLAASDKCWIHSSEQLDLWQHMLNEIQVAKRAYESTN